MSREIPEGWRTVDLGDVAKESRARNSDLGISEERLVGVFKDQGMIPMRDRVRGASVERCKVVKPGDFAYNPMRINIGSIARSTADAKVMVSPDYVVFSPDPNQIDGLFLDYLRKSDDWAAFVGNAGDGGVRIRIYFEHLARFRFNLPPLHEQRRIAEILSSVDEAIAATRAVIEQTRKVKQGVLERLLTKGIGHTRFKQTEIGEIPEGWPLANADDICTQISVGIVVKPSQYYVESGVCCFRSANVREGFVEDADWVYISEEGNRVNQKSVLRAGDVLVVRTGYPGTSCVVPPRYDGANCIDIIFARPKIELVDPYFLSTFINSASGKTQVLKAEGGLAQKHFNVGAMKQMKLPLPPLHEQHEIVAHIQEFASTEAALERILEQRLRLKSALMSDLLTGRKRVTDALLLAAE